MEMEMEMEMGKLRLWIEWLRSKLCYFSFLPVICLAEGNRCL